MIIKEFKSQPIELDEHELSEIQTDLNLFLVEINQKTQYQLWGRTKDFKDLIAGSFGAFLNITTFTDVVGAITELKRRGVDRINDIDVMIPLGTDGLLREALTSLEVPHRKVSTQVHSIVELGGKSIQVDFTLKAMQMAPCDFVRQTAFWSVTDQLNGIKSVYHQLLLGSLTAANNDVDAFSISYGLRVRNDDEEKREYETDILAIANRLFNADGKNIIFPKDILFHECLSHFYGICYLMDTYLNDDEINRVLTKFEHRLEGLRKTEKYDKAQELAAWKIIDRVLADRPIIGKSHAPST